MSAPVNWRVGGTLIIEATAGPRAMARLGPAIAGAIWLWNQFSGGHVTEVFDPATRSVPSDIETSDNAAKIVIITDMDDLQTFRSVDSAPGAPPRRPGDPPERADLSQWGRVQPSKI
jgi:hypothetical protein